MHLYNNTDSLIVVVSEFRSSHMLSAGKETNSCSVISERIGMICTRKQILVNK